MFESSCTSACDACQCNSKTKRMQNLFLEKENLINPAKDELSFYGSTSPLPFCAGTSPSHCNHNIISRRPLEDHDLNSRDSGFVQHFHDEDGRNFSSYASPTRGSFSSASIGSMEDDFFEDFCAFEPQEDDLPKDFNKLISGPIVEADKKPESPKDLIIRPLFRRALSFDNARVSTVRTCLFDPITESRPFKRPEPPQENESPVNSKKQKFCEDEEFPEIEKPLLKRAFSATEESIMCAVQRSAEEPDLIGDFSKTFSLPLTPGRHQDLKSITSTTLAQLISGEYKLNISSFKVIDCRYPYEFQGGHIIGAVNIYTKEQCLEFLNGYDSAIKNSVKGRDILVFHCEFSSERGPNLTRYLREQDRQINENEYPCLHYPEIYLLEGGYKKFFEQYSSMCAPIAYTEMLHPEHENELRFFRLKSKTWNVDTRQRSRVRGNLKRLGI